MERFYRCIRTLATVAFTAALLVACIPSTVHAQFAAGGKAQPTLEPSVLILDSIGDVGELTLENFEASAGEAIVWEVADPHVVSLIEASGTRGGVRGVAEQGSTTVTVHYEGGSASATVVVSRALVLTPASALMALPESWESETQPTVELLATAYDADGTGPVTWELEKPELIDFTALGNRGFATARGLVGSSTVTARYRDLVATAHLVVADLKSNTVAVPSAWIDFEAVVEPGWLSLDTRAAELKIDVGDILVPADLQAETPGLLGRVTAVQETSKALRVRLDRATLTEAFDRYELELRGQPMDVEFESSPGDATAKAGNAWECEISEEGAGVSVGGFTAESPVLTLTPNIHARVGLWGLQSMNLTFDVDTNVAITGPTVNLDATRTMTFTCTRDLINIPLGGAPAAPFHFTYRIATALGIQGELALNAGSLSVSTFTLDYTANGTYGVVYTDQEGWEKVATHTDSGPDLDFIGFDEDFDIDFNLSVEPFLSASFGVDAEMATYEIFTLDLFTGQYGLVAEMNLPLAAVVHPVPPPTEHYRNPGWTVFESVTGALDVNPAWGESVITLFDEGPGLPSFELELFEITEKAGESAVGELQASDLLLPVGGSTDFDLQLSRFGLLERLAYRGKTVEFWAVRSDGTSTRFGTTTIDDQGHATMNWAPTEPGNYAVNALVYDALFGGVGMPLMSSTLDVVVGEAELELTPLPDGGGPPLPTSLQWSVDVPTTRAIECILDPGDGSGSVDLGDCSGDHSHHHTYTTDGVYLPTLTVTAGDFTDSVSALVGVGYSLDPVDGLTFIGYSGTGDSEGTCSTPGNAALCSGIIYEYDSQAGLHLQLEVDEAPGPEVVGIAFQVQSVASSRPHGEYVQIYSTGVGGQHLSGGHSLLAYLDQHGTLNNWPFTVTGAITDSETVSQQFTLSQYGYYYAAPRTVEWVVTDISWVVTNDPTP